MKCNNCGKDAVKGIENKLKGRFVCQNCVCTLLAPLPIKGFSISKPVEYAASVLPDSNSMLTFHF